MFALSTLCSTESRCLNIERHGYSNCLLVKTTVRPGSAAGPHISLFSFGFQFIYHTHVNIEANKSTILDGNRRKISHEDK